MGILQNLFSKNSAYSVSTAPGGTNYVSSNPNAVTTSVNAPVRSSMENPYDYINNLVRGFQTALSSSAQSALHAETAAAERQMDFQKEQNQQAMNFEAQQAELNRIFQQSSADKAMAFEAEQADKANAFSERMANTAYQRAVADLQAAGLNPILAVTQGSASSPAGIAGSASAASGASASGFSSSGAKANAASGKNADLQLLSLVVNSATSLLSDVISVVSIPKKVNNTVRKAVVK